MNIHTLKSLPEHFNSVWVGEKTFEIRKNDRDFKSGDFVILQEWADGSEASYSYDPLFVRRAAGYSGRIIIALITLVSDFAQQDNYVVLGISVYHKRNVRDVNPREALQCNLTR